MLSCIHYHDNSRVESTILIMNSLARRPIAAILLIFLAGFVSYANSFQVPFILDDYLSIETNNVIRNLDNFFTNQSGYTSSPNRVVAYLTFALNYHFGGLKVFGSHLLNLIGSSCPLPLVFSFLCVRRCCSLSVCCRPRR